MSDKIITITKIRNTDGTSWDCSFVEVDGIKRAIVRQDNSGVWVAEMMGCYRTQDTTKTFGWYETQQNAVDAVVMATASYPKYIVYPGEDRDVRLNYAALGIAHA